MTEPSSAPAPARKLPFLPATVLIAAIFACSIYANLSFVVTHKADYRYFPPFRPYVNVNANRHLGGEYFNMAQSLRAGEGFAHPFDRPTGPTAWQPPALPLLLAGLLWVCDGNRDGVVAVVVFLQVYVLIGTGLLVLALVTQARSASEGPSLAGASGLCRQTTGRLRTAVVAAGFFAALLCDFRLCFQATHDYWLVLLLVDLLIAGLCWCRPLQRWRSAAGWGLFGGLCALTSPIVAFAWGFLSLLLGHRQRAWSRLALALLVAGLTVTPWAV